MTPDQKRLAAALALGGYRAWNDNYVLCGCGAFVSIMARLDYSANHRAYCNGKKKADA